MAIVPIFDEVVLYQTNETVRPATEASFIDIRDLVKEHAGSRGRREQSGNKVLRLQGNVKSNLERTENTPREEFAVAANSSRNK